MKILNPQSSILNPQSSILSSKVLYYTQVFLPYLRYLESGKDETMRKNQKNIYIYGKGPQIDIILLPIILIKFTNKSSIMNY